MPERWSTMGEVAAHRGGNPDMIHKWITRRSLLAYICNARQEHPQGYATQNMFDTTDFESLT